MKSSGVKKESDAVYMLVANNEFHPQREKIGRKWEEIYAKIKDLGYEPDTKVYKR